VVNLPQGPKRVYVVTGVIMGDNKGLMEIDGYVESVRANFPCRICKAPFDSIQRCREYTVRTLGPKSTERFEAKNDGTFHCFQSCSLGGDGGVFRRIADWSVVSKQRRSTTRLTGIKKQ